jgi:hypothetical protein
VTISYQLSCPGLVPLMKSVTHSIPSTELARFDGVKLHQLGSCAFLADGSGIDRGNYGLSVDQLKDFPS